MIDFRVLIALSRPPDDPNDDEAEDEGDQETDESLARRLGFRPIDNETIRTIGRLRSLTNQPSFDRRDLENIEYLLDELIRLQHLENFTVEQLELIIHHLKLHRPFQTRSRALAMIQDRLPRRPVHSESESNPNVFDIWRERERRARLDSKDSLEEEGMINTGQQLRDVTEINHPTPPVVVSNGKSRVKQMARDIDTRSAPIRTVEAHRHRSPSPQQERQIIVEDRRPVNNNPEPSSDQHRVRQMVDRLESSSSDRNGSRTVSNRKSNQGGSGDHSSEGGSFRVTRREIHQSNGDQDSFVIRHGSPPDQVYIYRSHHRSPSASTRFELNRNDLANNFRRTAMGTTVSHSLSSCFHFYSSIRWMNTSIPFCRELKHPSPWFEMFVHVSTKIILVFLLLNQIVFR